jgi:hypothetical protein
MVLVVRDHWISNSQTLTSFEFYLQALGNRPEFMHRERE